MKPLTRTDVKTGEFTTTQVLALFAERDALKTEVALAWADCSDGTCDACPWCCRALRERADLLTSSAAASKTYTAAIRRAALEEAAGYFETPPTIKLNDSGDLGSRQRERVAITLRNMAAASEPEGE